MRRIDKIRLIGRSGLQGPKAFVLMTLGACLMVGAYPALGPAHAPAPQAIAMSFEQTVTGTVTHVRDGDTIEMGPIAIRLSRLDCAERDTEQGQRATEKMRALVHRAELTCDLSGRKSYDRHIGQCHLADGRDLARVMINTKTCKRFR